ncbi:hypothetical protein GBAR_LOCUS31215 [Geodia barretti]|uniref:Uncharacterized protein n=1 Tax=Geodia barretti TaxID=519541 RepID=A0AA35XH49_GEOBA|nr:hypothetical protein GBAR_LOCUS31215 [Geodia barretti]
MVRWRALPPTCLLKVRKVYYPIALQTPAIVKVFRMVRWCALPPTCSLKVREIYVKTTNMDCLCPGS